MGTHIADRDFELSKYNADVHIIDARSGLVRATPLRKAVAIVGAGHGRQWAPYDDPEWEVWSLNAVACTDRFGRLRADRWFEMHERKAQSENDMKWIGRCHFPLYLPPVWADAELDAAPHGEAPFAVRYPLEKVEERYGSYFCCSFAYMMALALLDGFQHIGLYGCELAYGTERERTLEYANVSWWAGLAEGLGVGIHLPPQSRIGRSVYRYGIEYSEEKAEVEDYVNCMRKADRQRGIDTTKPYDSGNDPWVSVGG